MSESKKNGLEDAIPRRHEVHCEPEDGDPTPPPDPVPEAMQRPVAQKSPAQWAYERVILYVKNFEAGLDAEHEIAMGFAGGDAGVLRIEGLGFFEPDIVTFFGTDQNGAKTQLIQHVTQLNVMLRALPKPKTSAKPRRIGFRLAADIQSPPAQK